MFDQGIGAGDLARARFILCTASRERRGQWRSLSAPRAHATLLIFKVAYMCPPICIACSTFINSVARRKADVDRMGGAARALYLAATERSPDELRDLLAGQISSYTDTAAFETKKSAGALNEIRFDLYQRMSTALGYAGAGRSVRIPLPNLVEDIIKASFPSPVDSYRGFRA